MKIEYSGQFKKDTKLAEKSNKDMEKLKTLLRLMIDGEFFNNIELQEEYCDHPLKGRWKGWRDAHIEPDWVLIYKYQVGKLLRFERTGSHSNLFR